MIELIAPETNDEEMEKINRQCESQLVVILSRMIDDPRPLNDVELTEMEAFFDSVEFHVFLIANSGGTAEKLLRSIAALLKSKLEREDAGQAPSAFVN